MVQVHRDRHGRALRQGERGPRDRCQRPVVGHAVLADREHHRRPGRLRTGDDRLGVLDPDDVERTDPPARGKRGADDLGHADGRHQRPAHSVTWVPASARW